MSVIRIMSLQHDRWDARMRAAGVLASAGTPHRRVGGVSVLIVDADLAGAHDLHRALAEEGHRPEIAPDLPTAIERLSAVQPSLTVWNAGRGVEPGALEVLRRATAAPILVLADAILPAEHARGFRIGYDACLVRPFTRLQLHWHLRDLLERAASDGVAGRDEAGPRGGRAGDDGIVRFADVVVNLGAHEIRRGDRVVELRPREFDLLAALIGASGRVVTRARLLQVVWGYAESVRSRTIDTHVTALRRKLERDPPRPRHIVTVRKVGYRFEP